MNREEAKKILRAYRPSEQNQLNPHFAEALKLAGEDSELGDWLEQETGWDKAIAAKLGALTPPADLRGRILSDPEHRGAQINLYLESEAQLRVRFHYWIAGIAAVIALCAGIAFYMHAENRGPLAPWQSSSLTELDAMLAGEHKFDVESSNSTELRNWLREIHAPNPVDLPALLQQAATLGCKAAILGNKRVSIICFHTSPTKIAHLVTVDQHDLTSPPPEHQPQFVQKGEWTTASWSDRGQSFMLAIKGGSESDLRTLLAANG